MRRFKCFKRKSAGEIALHILVSAIFMMVAVSYLYILVFAFVSGLKTNKEIALAPFALPEVWNWRNYIDVFSLLEVNKNNFFDMLFNSVWFSVVGVLIQQFVSVSLAYCCTKHKFPGSNVVYPIILVMITLPIYGNSGAVYKLYHDIGILNSYTQVMTYAGGFNIFFLYYVAFFKNLSWTYAEAAMMDGANAFDIYYRVMLPQAKPMMGALFLTSWIQNWNSYENALIYLSALPTLPVGIYQFSQEMIYRARMDILFAACVLISIPALILFIAFNKLITTNVSVGGIKG